MFIYKPYTYLIGWSNLDRWYYGVRYAKGCHPEDFWKTYFTSSDTVQEYRRKFGEPNIIEIRKIFSDKEKAQLWEINVLTKLEVTKNKKWLNKRIPGKLSHDHMMGGEIQRNLAKRRFKEGTHNFQTGGWNTEKVECPKCGKKGQKAAMQRWHFDNCNINFELLNRF